MGRLWNLVWCSEGGHRMIVANGYRLTRLQAEGRAAVYAKNASGVNLGWYELEEAVEHKFSPRRPDTAVWSVLRLEPDGGWRSNANADYLSRDVAVQTIRDLKKLYGDSPNRVDMMLLRGPDVPIPALPPENLELWKWNVVRLEDDGEWRVVPGGLNRSRGEAEAMKDVHSSFYKDKGLSWDLEIRRGAWIGEPVPQTPTPCKNTWNVFWTSQGGDRMLLVGGTGLPDMASALKFRADHEDYFKALDILLEVEEVAPPPVEQWLVIRVFDSTGHWQPLAKLPSRPEAQEFREKWAPSFEDVTLRVARMEVY